jgi:hypothetical protein
MGKVNVIIVDATGNKEQKVGLPDDIKCGIIMVKLVEKIKLPSVGPDGNPISYKFIHKVTGRQLLESQTLGEAGIKDGDVLRLQPEITAGAFCPKCGSNVDGAFCPQCGNKMEEEPAPAYQAAPQQNAAPAFTPVQPATNGGLNGFANKNAKKGKLICSIIGAIGGFISIILGFVVSGMSTGSWESNTSYGGDAYTGIQNAAAQTANNVQDLAVILKTGMSSALIIFGIAMIAYFGLKFFKNTEKN